MFSTTPTHRIPSRAAIAAALALTAACAAPAGALAAETPTIGAPTIIPAGQQSPIDVGGNHLHQHDLIRKGTELVRWPVAMHGKRRAPITLTCRTGTIHSGLGLQGGQRSRLRRRQGQPVLHTHDRHHALREPLDVTGGRRRIRAYALCRDTAIAPLAPAIGDLTVREAGQKSPVDVAGNHRPSNATTTLSCPKGMVHRGLAQQEGSKVSATVLKTSGYGHRTIKVRFRARPARPPAASTRSAASLARHSTTRATARREASAGPVRVGWDNRAMPAPAAAAQRLESVSPIDGTRLGAVAANRSHRRRRRADGRQRRRPAPVAAGGAGCRAHRPRVRPRGAAGGTATRSGTLATSRRGSSRSSPRPASSASSRSSSAPSRPPRPRVTLPEHPGLELDLESVPGLRERHGLPLGPAA